MDDLNDLFEQHGRLPEETPEEEAKRRARYEEEHVYTNEVDDGHAHKFDLLPDDDMGVDNAVMCSKCGLLSVADEPEDDEDEELEG